jgi:hypothetical protein
MPSSFVLELVRQLLRWLSVWLISVGLPEPLAALVQDPEFVANVAAAISLSIAEGGWVVVKAKQFRAWLRARSWWGA